MTFGVACTLFGASAIGLFLSLRLVHRRALRLTLVILLRRACHALPALHPADPAAGQRRNTHAFLFPQKAHPPQTKICGGCFT